ncbi:MAG: hypothetical protein PHS97_04260 [Oscillospiraceae bacterium]|nr:hypothetical protein [Oscillospiraceae bacterium]
MYCSKCGKSAEGKYCPICGAPMTSDPFTETHSFPPLDEDTFAHMPAVVMPKKSKKPLVIVLAIAAAVAAVGLFLLFGLPDRSGAELTFCHNCQTATLL